MWVQSIAFTTPPTPNFSKKAAIYTTLSNILKVFCWYPLFASSTSALTGNFTCSGSKCVTIISDTSWIARLTIVWLNPRLKFWPFLVATVCKEAYSCKNPKSSNKFKKIYLPSALIKSAQSWRLRITVTPQGYNFELR